jgi:hypothetical protein
MAFEVGSGAYAFTWQEDEQPNLGEGISRPKAKAKTTMFKLLVKPSRSMPMTVMLPAENKAAAVRYAQARWPQAEIAVLEEEKKKQRKRS